MLQNNIIHTLFVLINADLCFDNNTQSLCTAYHHIESGLVHFVRFMQDIETWGTY